MWLKDLRIKELKNSFPISTEKFKTVSCFIGTFKTGS